MEIEVTQVKNCISKVEGRTDDSGTFNMFIYWLNTHGESNEEFRVDIEYHNAWFDFYATAERLADIAKVAQEGIKLIERSKGMNEKIRIKKVVKTCSAYPSQWDMWSEDGRIFLVAFRNDVLRVFGPSDEESKLYKDYKEGGMMATQEMRYITRDMFDYADCEVEYEDREADEEDKELNFEYSSRDFRGHHENILLSVPEGMQWAWARYARREWSEDKGYYHEKDMGRLEEVSRYGWNAVLKSDHPEIELPDNLGNTVDTSPDPDFIIVNNLILVERSLSHPMKAHEDFLRESQQKHAEELLNNRLNNPSIPDSEMCKKAMDEDDILSDLGYVSCGDRSMLSVLENNDDKIINRIKNRIIAFFYGKISRSELIQLIESKTGMFNSFGRAMIDDSVKDVEASLVMQVDINAYYKYILHNYFDCAMLDKEGEIYDKWICLRALGFHKKIWTYSKGRCRGLTFFTKDKSIKEQIEY